MKSFRNLVTKGTKYRVKDTIEFSTDEGEWVGTITKITGKDVEFKLPSDLEGDWNKFVKKPKVIKTGQIIKKMNESKKEMKKNIRIVMFDWEEKGQRKKITKYAKGFNVELTDAKDEWGDEVYITGTEQDIYDYLWDENTGWEEQDIKRMAKQNNFQKKFEPKYL